MSMKAALALAALCLAACGPPTPYWAATCEASHEELQAQVKNGINSMGHMSAGPIAYVPVDVCDRWSAPQCIVPPGATGACGPPT